MMMDLFGAILFLALSASLLLALIEWLRGLHNRRLLEDLDFATRQARIAHSLLEKAQDSLALQPDPAQRELAEGIKDYLDHSEEEWQRHDRQQRNTGKSRIA